MIIMTDRHIRAALLNLKFYDGQVFVHYFVNELIYICECFGCRIIINIDNVHVDKICCCKEYGR